MNRRRIQVYTLITITHVHGGQSFTHLWQVEHAAHEQLSWARSQLIISGPPFQQHTFARWSCSRRHCSCKWAAGANGAFGKGHLLYQNKTWRCCAHKTTRDSDWGFALLCEKLDFLWVLLSNSKQFLHSTVNVQWYSTFYLRDWV